jgi:Na+-driven multidrug efflux pump
MFAPLWSFPILGSTFFQAIGKPKPSLIINLSRDLLFFIPAIIVLPRLFGLIGVWISWPFTDFSSFVITAVFLFMEIRIINRNIESGRVNLA